MGQDTSSKVIQRRPAFAIVTDNPAFSGIPSPSLQLKPPKPPPPEKSSSYTASATQMSNNVPFFWNYFHKNNYFATNWQFFYRPATFDRKVWKSSSFGKGACWGHFCRGPIFFRHNSLNKPPLELEIFTNCSNNSLMFIAYCWIVKVIVMLEIFFGILRQLPQPPVSSPLFPSVLWGGRELNRTFPEWVS